MCGISLIVNGSRNEVQAMGEAIKHRGTRHNIFEHGKLKVWFSCLPITDQSAPMQPYFYEGKYFWLNGYISNYKELAAKHNIELLTNCDTELLSKFKGNYLELNGFFSVVIYDSVTGKLNAFTDRYGIKQLYRYHTGKKTFISSEIKGIQAVNKLEIDERAANDWLYSLGVMTDHTIYKDVQRVDCLPFIKPDPISISYDEAKVRLNQLLDQSITRNKTDLNDGVFLSGGIDSGILAKRLNPKYCFSVDYQSEKLSEWHGIKLNSKGNHFALLCNEFLYDNYKFKAVDVLDDLNAGSCYTNFALTELASKFCTVLYSGAGGDEVFDGYTHRYNREINEVIKRTNETGPQYEITHKEYDWRYLKSILVVEDRMSGFHTMETRYPFLDNDLVNFALSIPDEYKKDKRILKDISGLHTEVVNGNKKGFSNPVSSTEWTEFCLRQVTSRASSF